MNRLMHVQSIDNNGDPVGARQGRARGMDRGWRLTWYIVRYGTQRTRYAYRTLHGPPRRFRWYIPVPEPVPVIVHVKSPRDRSVGVGAALHAEDAGSTAHFRRIGGMRPCNSAMASTRRGPRSGVSCRAQLHDSGAYSTLVFGPLRVVAQSSARHRRPWRTKMAVV